MYVSFIISTISQFLPLCLFHQYPYCSRALAPVPAVFQLLKSHPRTDPLMIRVTVYGDPLPMLFQYTKPVRVPPAMVNAITTECHIGCVVLASCGILQTVPHQPCM